METLFRKESDSIGTMDIPADAYYGVQSLRAKYNFPITGNFLHPLFICNMAKVKKAAAITNKTTGKLLPNIADAIIEACDEIISKKLYDHFIVDAIQGGAGTSANMNANEVIANRAIEILGGTKGDYSIVHPNDHVNMAQSTNDIIPTSGKITVLELIDPLVFQLTRLVEALMKKSEEFDKVLKIGRTQLQDAVPMRLGQSFHAFASVIKRDVRRLNEVKKEMYSVNL
ncbi:MAG: lyase family protein, partial [Clostridiales bacterium]|nr:lyase family protein [Clostridiales bacterium]